MYEQSAFRLSVRSTKPWTDSSWRSAMILETRTFAWMDFRYPWHALLKLLFRLLKWACIIIVYMSFYVAVRDQHCILILALFHGKCSSKTNRDISDQCRKSSVMFRIFWNPLILINLLTRLYDLAWTRSVLCTRITVSFTNKESNTSVSAHWLRAWLTARVLLMESIRWLYRIIPAWLTYVQSRRVVVWQTWSLF